MARSVFIGVMVALGGLAPLPAQRIRLRLPFEELEARARRDSNDAVALYDLGLAYWSKKRFDDAERELRQAVAIEPRFAQAWLALAYLPFGRRPKLLEEEGRGRVPAEWQGAIEESARLRRRAFLLDPLVDLRIVGAVMSRGSSSGPDPFQAFLNGNYALAYHWLGDALQRSGAMSRDSVAPAVLWFHGLAAAHLSLYDTAIVDFQALLDRGVQAERGDTVIHLPLATNDYRYVLALLKYRTRHWVDAVELYQEALTYDAGLFMAHVQIGKIYAGHRMWDKAIAEFQLAVAANPEDHSLLLDLGVVLRDAGRLSEAEATLRQAMAAAPRDSRVPYHLGIALEQAERPADAREILQRFLALAPSRYEAQIADAKRRLAELP